ncbi:MAG: hypothetical protein CVV49_08860 [Spirochaetae bacterium HGW-Spirochaetae-5]|nr:MAG: hypothetical protein CVV49_08860 [Spirochaetae bacterium HGW-Spirochaetae-5]
MKLIKTVKGEEIVMDFADEVQAQNLLRTDKRYRPAEDQGDSDPQGDEVLEVDGEGIPLPEIDPENSDAGEEIE